MCSQNSCCGDGKSHHSHHSHHRHSGDCCGEGSWRRFVSKAEKSEILEKYKKELEAELAAVNELLEKKV